MKEAYLAICEGSGILLLLISMEVLAMTKVILADDLTGALDSGVKFLIKGPVIVQISSCGTSSLLPKDSFVVVNTGTREMKPEKAKGVLTRIIDSLAIDNGKTLLFKKIDSNMRGNVGAELEAIYASSDFKNFLLCPANPPQGRKVQNARVYLDNRPLSEKSISEILASQTNLPVRHLSIRETQSLADHPNDFAEILNRFPIISFDAVDLKTLLFGAKLLKCAQQFNRKILPVGSAGFASALALLDIISTSSVLLVSGSIHPKSIGQVEKLLDQIDSSLRVVVLGNEEDVGYAVLTRLQQQGRCAVINSLDPYPDECLFLEVIKNLGRLLSTKPPELILVNGGETASALLEGLGVSHLEVQGELENGVVLSKSPSFYFVSKSGGFGDEDTLLTMATLGGFVT